MAAASLVGLQVNIKKTEVLTTPSDIPGDLSLNGNLLPRVTSFRYLGGVVPGIRDDFRRRKQQAWAACTRLNLVWRSRTLPNIMKIRIFSTIVESIFLYNSETWSLTNSLESEISSAHSALLRHALNVKSSERRSNLEVFGEHPRAHELLKRRRLQLAGHMIRCEGTNPQVLHRVLLSRFDGPNHPSRQRLYWQLLARDICLAETTPEMTFQKLKDEALKRSF